MSVSQQPPPADEEEDQAREAKQQPEPEAQLCIGRGLAAASRRFCMAGWPTIGAADGLATGIVFTAA